MYKMKTNRVSSLPSGRLRSPRGAAWLLAVLAVVPAREVRAAEALLATGKTLRIEGHRAEGSSIRLILPGGGALELPAERVVGIREEEPRDPSLPGGPEPTRAQPDVPGARSPEAGTEPLELDRWIDESSDRHGVDPRLVRAVIQVESGWNPRAVSPRGAMGLMQLMPGTARARGVLDPFDPIQNVEAGTAELAETMAQYAGEVALALAAYNAGGSTVDRYDGIPPYWETLGYVRRVLDLYFSRPLSPAAARRSR